MRTATVYNFLLEATLMASIAILLMIPIRKFLRKSLSSRVLTFGWLLVAIRLLCPLSLPNPIIHEIRSPFAPDAAIRPIAGQLKVRVADVIGNMHAASYRSSGAASERLNDLVESTYNGMLSINLMKLYVIGLLLVLAWFVISNVRFRMKLRADRIEPISGELLAQYQALCSKLGLKKPLPVYFVDPLPSACLVGVFRPYIALPLTAAPQDVMLVLRHELCHAKAKDHWWGAVRLACCAIHWFNPLVWLAAHMSRTDSELACDERVSRNLTAEGRNAYAGVLVLAAARRDLPGVAVLSTGMSMTGKKLKHRVAGILANRRMHKGLALAFVLLSSMALVGAFATSEIAPKLEPDLHSHQIISAQTEVKAFDLKDEQSWIDFAKTVWQNPYLKAKDLDSLQWSASTVRDTSHTEVDHTEVLGCNAEGEIMLASAFLEDGTLIYISNFAEMSTQYMVVDTPKYEGYPTRWEPVRDFGLETIESLRPGYTAKYTNLSEPSEGKADGGRMSLFFGQHTDYNYISTFRVQVEPESRLIYFVDLEYMSHNDTDRLAPGNG